MPLIRYANQRDVSIAVVQTENVLCYQPIDRGINVRSVLLIYVFRVLHMLHSPLMLIKEF